MVTHKKMSESPVVSMNEKKFANIYAMIENSKAVGGPASSCEQGQSLAQRPGDGPRQKSRLGAASSINAAAADGTCNRCSRVD